MSTSTADRSSIAYAAHRLLASALSVIPIANLQDKRPMGDSWKPFMHRRADGEEAASWFKPNGHAPAQGIAVVCGAVSAGLTVIDFDVDEHGRSLYPQWRDLVEQIDDSCLFDLPIVATPSGGKHVYFRCDVVEGNTKLAETAARYTLIETRGEGGYVVAPPTPGYVKLAGTLTNIPVISPSARQMLLDAARMLDCRPPAPARDLGANERLPGSAYDQRATLEGVLDLLKAHSWTVAGESGDSLLLRRPGKERGTSATLHSAGGMPVFYCFSTNAPMVPAREPLGPFRLYAHLAHGGDYKEAAAAVARMLNLPTSGEQAGAPATGAAEPPIVRRPAKRLADLLARDIPDVPFVVPNIIPPGLMLLAGAPKMGKSLLCLGMGLGVAAGGYVLGTVKVEGRPVVYYALEDGERILRKRALTMLAGGACPEQFFYHDEYARLDQGALAHIEEDLKEHPNALLIVDTYQRIRPRGQKGFDAYQTDANGLEDLAKLVLRLGIACVLVHHTTKSEAEDFLANVSGSYGLTATAATIGVLRRSRSERECRLSLTGREYGEDREIVISYEPETMSHTLLGDAAEVGANRAQQDIIDFLREEAEPRSPKEIALGVGRENDPALRMLLGRMVEAGTIVKNGYGRYEAVNCNTVTPVTPISAAPDCDSPVTVDSAKMGVTPVTVDTSGDSPPVQQPLMRTEKCSVCGANTPYWAPLGEGEKPYCPTHAPKKRRQARL